MQLENLFHTPRVSDASSREIFETLCASGAVRIERIISNGQSTPANTWLSEEHNEWVTLLQGNAIIGFADGTVVQLLQGDYINIPSGTRHRVDFTSHNPPCIWLAVFYP